MNFKTGDLHPNSPHLFADLVELLLIVRKQEVIHKNDVMSEQKSSDVSFDEIDLEEQENNAVAGDSERMDRHEKQIEDVWQQLEFRAGMLNEKYPFIVDGDFLRIREHLTDIQKIYIFLLACSRLRSFSGVKKNGKSIIQLWAGYFTHIGKYSVKALLPPYAVTRVFDANSEDRKTYYGTDLRDALVNLGKDLAVLNINDQECKKASSSGDAGFDIVGVVDFKDGCCSNYAILAQCGAQEKEWPKKTLEAHPFRLRNFFQTTVDNSALMITPIFYRQADGSWVNSQPTAGVYIVDRARILYLLNESQSVSNINKEDWFIDFIQYVELPSSA